MLEVILALLAAGAGWFVWDGLKAREAANAAMRDACRQRGFLFLDDTVALGSLRPARDEAGTFRLRRVYTFEFSDTGTNRRRGQVTLLGATIEGVQVEPVAPVTGPWPDRP